MATILTIVYSVKIANLKLTQTYTWLLIAIAFGLRFLTQLFSIYYANTILGFYGQFDINLVLITQFIEVIIITLFFVAVLRSYYGVSNIKLKSIT